MTTHAIMITNNANFHPADYHAEITAAKLVVVSDSATGATIEAARDFRKKVEAILLRHHTDTEASERAALVEHGADRYDDPLRGDSAQTGHSIVDDSIMKDIIAAARGTALATHFAQPAVQAAMLSEIHHETRSHMRVLRDAHRADNAASRSVS